MWTHLVAAVTPDAATAANVGDLAGFSARLRAKRAKADDLFRTGAYTRPAGHTLLL